MSRPQAPKLADLGLQPEIGADMPSLLRRLDESGLTHLAEVFDQGLEYSLPGATALGGGFALAQATSRQAVRPLRSEELKALKERFKDMKVLAFTASPVNSMDCRLVAEPAWASMYSGASHVASAGFPSRAVFSTRSTLKAPSRRNGGQDVGDEDAIARGNLAFKARTGSAVEWSAFADSFPALWRPVDRECSSQGACSPRCCWAHCGPANLAPAASSRWRGSTSCVFRRT